MTDKKYDRIKCRTSGFKLVEFGAQQVFIDIIDNVKDKLYYGFEESIGRRRTESFGHEYPIGFLARNFKLVDSLLISEDFSCLEEHNKFINLIKNHKDHLEIRLDYHKILLNLMIFRSFFLKELKSIGIETLIYFPEQL